MQEAREEEKKKKKQQNLFKGLKFFLNRETNIESLTFVIRACRGEVSWQGAVLGCIAGSCYVQGYNFQRFCVMRSCDKLVITLLQ